MYIQYNLTLPAIQCGGTYSINVNVTDSSGTPINLSAYEGASKGVRGKVRPSLASATTITTFTATYVGGASTGVINLLLPSTSTAACSTYTEGVYDVEAYDASVTPELVEKLFGGKVKINKEATR